MTDLKVFALFTTLILQHMLFSAANGIPADWEEYIPEGSPRVSHSCNRNLTECDIIEDPIQFRSVMTDSRWEMGILPYEFDSAFEETDTQAISKMMRKLENISCVRFVSRTTETDYIFIRHGDDCSSKVGRYGGMQTLNLNKRLCMINGIIIHELLHALGFLHEHVRPDRDKFVKVNYDNIDREDQRQYQLRSVSDILGTQYDYGSIMHYGLWDHAINKTIPTLLPVRKGIRIPIGQRERLSRSDIVRLRLLYDCPVSGQRKDDLTTEQPAEDSPTHLDIPKNQPEIPVQRAIRWLGDRANGCIFNTTAFQTQKISDKRCAAACAGTFGCTHFVHRPGTGDGTCYFMGGTVSRHNAVAIEDFLVVCGVTEESDEPEGAHESAIVWKGNLAHGCRFASRIFETAVMKELRCGRFCASVGGCTHFRWDPRVNNGTCFLYSGTVDKSDAVRDDAAVICGIV